VDIPVAEKKAVTVGGRTPPSQLLGSLQFSPGEPIQVALANSRRGSSDSRVEAGLPMVRRRGAETGRASENDSGRVDRYIFELFLWL
jgi:hypothetical protein